MRHHIQYLSSHQLTWEQLSQGVYRKNLNFNNKSGERSALYRFVPNEGASAPDRCHYHSVFEELFILDGKMTFDRKRWLNKHGYIFHPPFAVHGFNSEVPTETIFISRTPQDLDFNFPEQPHSNEPYFIDNKTNPVNVIYLNPPSEQTWDPILNTKGVEVGRQILLKRDETSGEKSLLIRYDKGFAIPANKHGYKSFNEGFVISGEITTNTTLSWKEGDYWHRHPDTPTPSLQIEKNTLLFLTQGLL